MRRIAFGAAAALLAISPNVLAGPLEDGISAYRSGDYQAAMKLWQPLADANVPDALYGIALLYDEGQGVKINDEEAIRYYRRAAHLGHAAAQANLAIMYDDGEGMFVDDYEAVYWYRQAAEQGHTQAENNLGAMLDHGEGVAEDDAEAAEWYLRAAEKKHPLAQMNIGVLHYNGTGVPQDYLRAHMWFNLAAAQGVADAATNRDTVAAELSSEQLAEAQRMARDWIADHSD